MKLNILQQGFVSRQRVLVVLKSKAEVLA